MVGEDEEGGEGGFGEGDELERHGLDVAAGRAGRWPVPDAEASSTADPGRVARTDDRRGARSRLIVGVFCAIERRRALFWRLCRGEHADEPQAERESEPCISSASRDAYASRLPRPSFR